MKAKEWYKQFEMCETSDEFEKKLEECLIELVDDADKLIIKRKAKSHDAIASCINEVNQKYKAIINIHENKKKNHESDILGGVTILDDGFKAAYVLKHPDREWYFNINNHMKKVEERRDEIEMHEKAVSNIIPYNVTPFEELTMETLTKEILCCTMALGSYVGAGIPVDWIRPLAYRIGLLRWWKNNGEINLEDVEEFKKDEAAWVRSHNV